MTHPAPIPFVSCNAYWPHLLAWAILIYAMATLLTAVGQSLARHYESLVTYFASMRLHPKPLTGASPCTRFNEVARTYYMAVYGGGPLSPIHRMLRLAAIFCGTALALRFIVVQLVLAYGGPLLAARFSWMFGFYGFVVASLAYQDYRCWRATGQPTLSGRRQYIADGMLEEFGKSTGFLAAVKQNCGGLPPTPARFLTPFWPEDRVRLLLWIPVLCLAAVAAALYGGHIFYGSYVNWLRAGDGVQHLVLAVLTVLLTVVVLYLFLLVLGVTSRWHGTPMGRRYFPLQVLCQDLQKYS